MAFDNNIHILCLPTHTSHALQPLDVACFRPAKAICSDIVLSFYRTHIRKNLGKADFPSLLKVVTEHLVSRPTLAVAGFQAAGIRLINMQMVSKQIVTPDPNNNCALLSGTATDRQHKQEILKVL